MSTNLEYQEDFTFDESCFTKYGVSFQSVLSIFHKVARTHAELLGVGFESMLSQNSLWIDARIKYQILQQPKPNQKLIIKTYPSGTHVIQYYRDYLIFDEYGNLLIKGISIMCLIDMFTRHAKLIKTEIPVLENMPSVFEDRFLKTETFDPPFLADYSYQVQVDDIDQNKHVNNTVYAKLVDNVMQLSHKKIKFFQINFIKETLLGERLDIYKLEQDNMVKLLGKVCEGTTKFTALIETEEE